MGERGEAFYAVGTLPPPLGIKVRVIWQTRKGVTVPFDCVRWIKNGRTYWSTFVDGSLVNLPIARRDRVPAYWTNFQHLEGPTPLYWAPPAPAHTWAAPLPAPAFFWREPPSEVRMAYEQQDFSAADLAYEMECERAGLIAEPQPDQRRERIGRVAWQWWRDETKITWGQSAGDLLIRDCEGRLMRAIALSAAGRVGAHAASVTSKALANAIGETAGYATDDASVPLKACQRDVGENFLEAMRWFTALGEGQDGWSISQFSRPQKVLLWRALPMPMSFAEIGELLANPPTPGKKKKKPNKPITGERIRQIHDEAIERAWRVGAGLVTTGAEIAVAQLRERNRRVKRHSLETA